MRRPARGREIYEGFLCLLDLEHLISIRSGAFAATLMD